MLRSASAWSTGSRVEHSIQNAWIAAIEASVHFVYIENQFFIGNLAGHDIKNGVAQALLNRLVTAVNNRSLGIKLII